MNTIFSDRSDAGRALASALGHYRGTDAIVLGLPRGGVIVAYEVAEALDLPLDVFVVRKLGVPGREELAMGAIASGGVRVLNKTVLDSLGIPGSVVEHVSEAELEELRRREEAFRVDRPRPRLAGRSVLLVDDGLATGSTMMAAVTAVSAAGPARLIVAVPVGAPETCRALAGRVDEVICLHTPDPFSGVGAWYREFDQTEDNEVRERLARAARDEADRRGSRAPRATL